MGLISGFGFRFNDESLSTDSTLRPTDRPTGRLDSPAGNDITNTGSDTDTDADESEREREREREREMWLGHGK